MTPDNISRVLTAMVIADEDPDNLFWRLDEKTASILECYVICSDVFYWACADLQMITDENVDVFVKSQQEAPEYGSTLFCARVRKMRPQSPMYEYVPAIYHDLFNECGPERDVKDE